MDKSIKVLIFSDGHGKREKLQALENKMANYDLLLFAGDFTKFNAPETGKPYLDEILACKKPFFSVLGNCDYPELLNATRERKCSVDACVKQYGELFITGSGGGSKFTGTTPNERSDEELVSDFVKAEKKIQAHELNPNALIVISHNPPHQTTLDTVPGGFHVGSKLIREFIETYQPLLHISGHIHESIGIDKIGKTVLVNPGSLNDGRYADCEIVKTEEGFEVRNLVLRSL